MAADFIEAGAVAAVAAGIGGTAGAVAGDRERLHHSGCETPHASIGVDLAGGVPRVESF